MDQDNSLNSKLSIADAAFLHCPKCKSLFARNIAYCTSDGTKLEESAPSKATLFAGKYEILDEIGSGGMGTVYRVRQILLDKIYALKLIPEESLNDLLITRFQREAKTMATLDHANLGRIVDFGIHENQPFMVMEFVNGIPLNKLLSETRLSIEETIDIFAQVSDGLAHAHKKGVLHRDIKPSNIMIVQNNAMTLESNATERKAILLDFGIAKKLDTTDDTIAASSKIQALTRTGEMIGSPLYMSPEQCRGERLTERSDLYSFGCALFESLAGTAPFVGKSTVDTLIAHMEKPAPTLKEASLGREFPGGLERVLNKLLSKDPTNRYGSADETKRALALALKLDDEQVSTRQEENSSAVLQHTAMILVAVLLLATVSIVAYLTMQGEEEARSQKTTLKQDTIKVEEAWLDYGDKQYLGKQRKSVGGVERTKASAREEENEDYSADDDNDVERYPDKLKYTPLSGKEEGLALRFENLDEARVKAIEQNKNLQRLGLAAAKFPHSMLGNLSGRIKVFRLSATKITDDDLQYVAKNAYLERLLLNANPFGDKGLSHLGSLPRLEFLDIAKTRCSAKGIQYLRSLPRLNSLFLHNCNSVDDKAAEAVSSLRGLTELSLDNTKVTGRGVAYLQRLPKLATVSLGHLRLRDNDLTALGQIKTLTTLHLDKNKVTSEGVKHLLPLKNLMILDLQSNPVDDKVVGTILQMPALRYLDLSASDMTPKGVMKLSSLPNLRSLHIRRVAGVTEPDAHAFMTKCKSCMEVVFLSQKDSAYTRQEWAANEQRRLDETKQNEKSGE